MSDKPQARLSTAGAAVSFLMLLAFVYVGSFVYLSCYGYDEPFVWSRQGYYFAEPITTAGGERHLLLGRIYWPLVELDANWITGRRPGLTLTQLCSCPESDTSR
ncbi:hypothetical protein [Blastopirellula marina]|uniref:Uncharacterized protein n=1 Tax=Blastopirellula marina DSM 3645 TaxID=314230 RepID=A3ZRW6_9BACT|nr:hypothetical protein [Blastopirellula marina]EAQ80885.1 hypothetical protein DSM3645_12731 [Blastopirellula marina DSM 3645]